MLSETQAKEPSNPNLARKVLSFSMKINIMGYFILEFSMFYRFYHFDS